MATKKQNSLSSLVSMFRKHAAKVVLGTVATGSFAIAFGQEKLQQMVSLSTSGSPSCLVQFYKETPPYLMRESLQKDSYALCFNGFNVMYSGVSKTPLWVAEALTPARLSQKIPREDSFHEEDRVSSAHRATLADYRGSGYDRGHMAPNADMPTKEAQHDSFSLANMVPQAPKNNQQVWRELEEATRAIVTKQKQEIYVVTGPVYEGKKLAKIGKGVLVPTAIYKAVYIPKLGVTGAYYAPNNNSLKVEIISICALEDKIGINLFPNVSEEKKRNTYHLPLTATAVKANKEIAYSHWDAESQCAEQVSSSQLNSLKKEFKSTNLVTSVLSSSSEQTEAPSNSAQNGSSDSDTALFKKLLQMLLEFILQLLR